MKKKLREILNKRKREQQLRREAEIKSRIYIKEKGGLIWLMCDDTAFYSINDADFTAKEIMAQLERCRDAAVRYTKL